MNGQIHSAFSANFIKDVFDFLQTLYLTFSFRRKALLEHGFNGFDRFTQILIKKNPCKSVESVKSVFQSCKKFKIQ
jgi:hypothetical protein